MENSEIFFGKSTLIGPFDSPFSSMVKLLIDPAGEKASTVPYQVSPEASLKWRV